MSDFFLEIKEYDWVLRQVLAVQNCQWVYLSIELFKVQISSVFTVLNRPFLFQHIAFTKFDPDRRRELSSDIWEKVGPSPVKELQESLWNKVSKIALPTDNWRQKLHLNCLRIFEKFFCVVRLWSSFSSIRYLRGWIKDLRSTCSVYGLPRTLGQNIF